MRQIVLDTETTGLDPALGHRVIEIAAVEVVHRRISGRHFHCYINPERASDAAALEVHGLTEAFLMDKPKFKEIVTEFLDFVNGAELIIHNAPFDVAFLNHELNLLDFPVITQYCARITDTLQMAKELHPGKRNNLDALCERYGVDNSARTLHGALLDAQLLGEVYLAMTRGQESLIIDIHETIIVYGEYEEVQPLDLPIVLATQEELLAHQQYLQEINKASNGLCLWATH